MSWYRYDASGTRLTLNLHVQPGAKQTQIGGLHGDALKVKVAAPPLQGAANAALLKLLSQRFGVPLRQVRLTAGASSRRKSVDILNPVISPEQVLITVSD